MVAGTFRLYGWFTCLFVCYDFVVKSSMYGRRHVNGVTYIQIHTLIYIYIHICVRLVLKTAKQVLMSFSTHDLIAYTFVP